MDLLYQQKQNHSSEPKLPIHSAHADKIGQAPVPRRRKKQRTKKALWGLVITLSVTEARREKCSSQTTYDTFGKV